VRLEEETMNLRSSTPNVSPTLNAMLIAVIIVATMYFAREVLIPVALAGILSFMLAPLALHRTACSAFAATSATGLSAPRFGAGSGCSTLCASSMHFNMAGARAVCA
jgi:hypothetical protein